MSIPWPVDVAWEAFFTVIMVCAQWKRAAPSKQNQNADKQKKGKGMMVGQKQTNEPSLCL